MAVIEFVVDRVEHCAEKYISGGEDSGRSSERPSHREKSIAGIEKPANSHRGVADKHSDKCASSNGLKFKKFVVFQRDSPPDFERV